MFKLSRDQAIVTLCGVYIFLSLVANIASTKLMYMGSLVTDAGIIYYLIFTWRDLIHKQLGKKVVMTTIYVAAGLNILAALFFQLVVLFPPEAEWALAGGQVAWSFIFGLQLRIMIASVLAFIVSEVVDTYVYAWWVKRHSGHQWLRVVVSNALSMPVDTMFALIAFYGVVSWGVMVQIFWTNILLKAIATAATFWMIYLVPEKKMYN